MKKGIYRLFSSICAGIMVSAIAMPNAVASFSIKELKWESGDKVLVVKGRKDRREGVTIYSASSGEQLGTVRSSKRREYETEIRRPAVVPCRVRAVQTDGETAERDVENAPANCDGDTQPPVENREPEANANGSYNGTVGVALSFSSQGSDDEDGTIVSYSWNFGDGSSSSAANPTHIYATPGNYTVTLTVTDNEGANNSDSTSVTVAQAENPDNKPPSADANGPYSGTTGNTINFSSSGSSDTDGDIVSYQWNFGDGSSSTSANPNHSYANSGNYSVTLTVTDDDGDTDTDTSSASVASTPDKDASFTIDEAAWESGDRRLVAQGKKDRRRSVTVYAEDSNDRIAYVRSSKRREWKISSRVSGDVPCFIRAVQSDGKVAELPVKDAPGDCHGGADNQDPIAVVNGPYSGTPASNISFSSAGSNDPDNGDTLSFDWSFGDGDSSSAENPVHAYSATGNYTVTLTVSDNHGGSDSTTTSAEITDVIQPGSVSINSTSKDSDGVNSTVVDQRPNIGNSGNYSILAINDLGMHCGDLDTRIASILPPFQVLLSQVILKGEEPEINPAGIDLYYSSVANPVDPYLGALAEGIKDDGSTYKTNFWSAALNQNAYDPFYPGGLGLTPLASGPFPVNQDVGLPVPNAEDLYIGPDGIVKSGDESLTAVQHAMPGLIAPYSTGNSGNAPQQMQEHYQDKPFFVDFPFGYVSEDIDWHEAAGIPFAAYDDFGRMNPYPLVRVEAKNASDTTVSSVDTVLPISGEASCTNCHSDNTDFSSVEGTGTRTSDPTDALTDAGLPVATSLDDPDSNMPAKVSLEYAADINILRLHDLKHGANYVTPSANDDGTTDASPCDITANSGNGDASCLTNKALVQNKPVVCQVCHYTPALDLAQVGPMTGPEGALANGRNQLSHKSNSNVMHGHHGQFESLFTRIPAAQQTSTGIITNQSERIAALQNNCYQCHPGKDTQCLRGAMFNGGMLCSDCHGDMQQVGADFSANVSPDNPGAFDLHGNFYTDASQPRVPWANEPGCGSCHTGDAISSLAGTSGTMINTVDTNGVTDGIRLRQAFLSDDPKATPIVPSNKRFAEPAVPASFNGFSNPGAGNPQLYRMSTGHGGVMCEGCHGATHAEWPNSNPNANDNVTANQLQGHTGAITECSVCHGNAMDNEITLDGPHGMHPVGNTRFSRGGHEDFAENNKNSCRSCHGQNGEGTVLSRVATDRVLNGEDGEIFRLNKGDPVTCYLCHSNEL